MIKIITDSTSYIPKDYAKKHNITVLQLRSTVDEKEYLDGDQTTYDEYFQKLTHNRVFPKTSQPSLEDIENAFKKVLKQGDEAIVITISSSLSGTYDTCKMVQKQSDPENKISVLDSGITAQVMFCYIQEAIELIEKNKSRTEITEHIKNLKKESNLTFVPDNLEFLQKGGRIGKVSAIMGSILQIKPILKFTDGVLTCIKKVLGMQRAITDLILSIPEKCKKIYLLQIAKSKFYTTFSQQIKEKFAHIPIFEGMVGHAVGAHIGPAIGLGLII